MDKVSFLDFKGKKIWYRLTAPSGNKKHHAILFIHGSHYSSSLSLLIDKLKKDFVCLTFAHLGCDKSGGKFEDYSLDSRLKQSLFVLDYLTNLHIALDITVVGASMGGHVAARLSQKVNIKNLILRAPASYRKDYEKQKMYPGWLPWDKNNKNWPFFPSFAFDAISQFKGNLLIVRCENDEIIPEKIIDEYYNKAVKAKTKKVELLKGAKHVMSDQPELLPTYTKMIADFDYYWKRKMRINILYDRGYDPEIL